MTFVILVIKPVNPKGNQSWIFIGRTDAEDETPILWPPDAKNWLIGKAPDAGKVSRQEDKGMAENEMVGWHHRLDRHEFEQTPGTGDGQGRLACCSPWGCKESDMTEQLIWIELTLVLQHTKFLEDSCKLGSYKIIPFSLLHVWCFYWDSIPENPFEHLNMVTFSI